MEEDIGQEVNGQGKVLINHLGIKTGIFPPGKGIQRPPDGVDLLGDVKGRPSFRSLKKKMFDEVRDSVFLRLFISRTGDHPYADRDRLEIRDLFRDHFDPIFENGLLIF